jgi:hypothetical protein
MVEKSDITNFILPPVDKMAVTATDSLNYHIDIVCGKNTLQALVSYLTTARVYVTTHHDGAALTTDGRD